VGLVRRNPAREARQGDRLLRESARHQASEADHEPAGNPLDQQVRREALAPWGGPEVVGILSGEDPFELSAGDGSHLLRGQAGLQRKAQHHQRHDQRRAVGRVAREQDLARRNEREEGREIGRIPP
jgi:hypothetical protein